MITLLDAAARIAIWLVLPPLLPGLINKVKAWVAGRRGPPIFQLYHDLAKLWRKGTVLSVTASPWTVAGPAVAWAALLGAALLLPLGPWAAPFSFGGDAILFIYLLALARFGTAGAALDAGSAFTGMGAAREVSFAVLGEAAMITTLLALTVQTGSLSLEGMLTPAFGPGVAVLAAGLFLALLAENCRVPFDDPNTHLELTMIHEVMVLDQSGPTYATVLHGAAMKLSIFSIFLIQAAVPMEGLPAILAGLLLLAALVVMALAVGLVESLLARLAFRKTPLFLTTAFLLCLFALLTVWGGRWS